eukprot:63467-Prorocentrum_minimum.AAC.1
MHSAASSDRPMHSAASSDRPMHPAASSDRARGGGRVLLLRRDHERLPRRLLQAAGLYRGGHQGDHRAPLAPPGAAGPPPVRAPHGEEPGGHHPDPLLTPS